MPTETSEGTATIQLDARIARQIAEILRRPLADAGIIVLEDDIAARGKTPPSDGIIMVDDISGRRADPQPQGREGIVTIDNIVGREGVATTDNLSGRGKAPQASEEIIVGTVDNISGRGKAPPPPQASPHAASVVLDAAEAARFHRILHAGLAAARTGEPAER
ncbi:MAG TPA: hypothetical protein VFQ45_13945 [Longimicrobium sp.]|nr:hypothetical protein [Longimicrobium sp.]